MNTLTTALRRADQAANEAVADALGLAVEGDNATLADAIEAVHRARERSPHDRAPWSNVEAAAVRRVYDALRGIG